MTKRVWKSYRPSSMRDALRACKDYAIEKKRLSVERVANLMGVTDESLYKWQSSAAMPAALIPTYEHICGVAFVTEWLAEQAGKIVIDIPKGHLGHEDVQTLQGVLHEAVGALIDLAAKKIDQEATLQRLMNGMEALAYHHANVKKFDQPELDL